MSIFMSRLSDPVFWLGYGRELPRDTSAVMSFAKDIRIKDWPERSVRIAEESCDDRLRIAATRELLRRSLFGGKE